MNLLQLADSYLMERDVSDDYANSVKHRIGVYQEYSGGQLDYGVASRWVASLCATFSPKTVRDYRSILLTMWNYAADLGLVERPDARRVRRVRVNMPPPLAWSTEEVRRLLAAAARKPYWLCYIRVSYETGLRRGDVLALEDISDQPFIVREHKTGLFVVKKCSPRTVRLFREIGGLAWHKDSSSWYAAAKRLVAKAGLTGTMRMLRRSNGSYTGGLGHSDSRVFRRHYYDPRLVEDTPMPPPLEKLSDFLDGGDCNVQDELHNQSSFSHTTNRRTAS